MSVWELVSFPPRVMATSASTTTTRMAAAMSTAAVGSRPKIRRDSLVVRGDAATSPQGLVTGRDRYAEVRLWRW